MKTAIITGFRPFGDYRVNPTEKLMQKLDNTHLQGHYVKSLVFATQVLSMDTGQQLVCIAKRLRAQVIISVGIASAARGIRLESSCRNWVENDKYCSPREQKKPIDMLRPEKETLTVNLRVWNLEKVFREFRKNAIPHETEISINAGSFCCNALMYRTLRSMTELENVVPYIFCHVPCTAETIEGVENFDWEGKVLITDEQLLKTIEILLGAYA